MNPTSKPKTPPRLGRSICSCFFAATLLLSAGSQARQPDYAARYSQATARESAGDLDGAMGLLTALASDYPDDFDVQLQLAWVSFRLGKYDVAERSYRRAIFLSQGHRRARLGLAWTLQRQGRRSQAHELFAELADSAPNQAELLAAEEGVKLTKKRALRLRASLDGSISIMSGHPYVTEVIGVSPRLGVSLFEHLLVSARYRYTRYGLENVGDSDDSGEQHEAFFGLGYAQAEFGLMAHYATIAGDETYGMGAQVLGLSARYSPWGDLLLEASASIYDDLNAYRAAISWSMPLGRSFRLVPMGSMQVVDGELMGAGGLSAQLTVSPVRLWVSGKYGDEHRAVYLSEEVVSNSDDHVRGSIGGGLSLSIAKPLDLSAGYTWQRREASDENGSPSDVDAHVVELGLTGTF